MPVCLGHKQVAPTFNRQFWRARSVPEFWQYSFVCGIKLQKLHVKENNKKRSFSSREASANEIMQNLHFMQNLHVCLSALKNQEWEFSSQLLNFCQNFS